MSFTVQESSAESGAPVEIYDIVMGETTFRFSSSADSVTYADNLYLPVSVVRDTLTFGANQRTQVVNIAIPTSHTFAQIFATSVPGQKAVLTLRRFHRTDTSAEFVTLFKGVCRAVSFTDQDGLARIAVMPISGALVRTIPRYTFQSLCNHVLYDSWCTKVATDFKYTGAIENIQSGSLFDVHGAGDANPDGYFDSGFAVFGGDYRLILKQIGPTVQLLLPFFTDITGGPNIDIYAGCDHSVATCLTKFGNVINFGGFPYVPTTNPFQTGLT